MSGAMVLWKEPDALEASKHHQDFEYLGKDEVAELALFEEQLQWLYGNSLMPWRPQLVGRRVLCLT